jgi:hypothetical protein
MRKTMMLAPRQTLTESRTTRLVPNTRVAACLPALPRAASAGEKTTRSKRAVANGTGEEIQTSQDASEESAWCKALVLDHSRRGLVREFAHQSVVK